MQGQAKEAAKLIALLGASPCLGNPGFQGQMQPDPRTGKERFQISAELKECSPPRPRRCGIRRGAGVQPPRQPAKLAGGPSRGPPRRRRQMQPAAQGRAAGTPASRDKAPARPRPSRPRRRSMAASRFQPKDGRFLAVVLLLIVLMLIYLIGVHWWFVAPQLQFAPTCRICASSSCVSARPRRRSPRSRSASPRSKRYEQGNQAFLTETDPNAASAALIQRLKQAISDHAKDEKRCQNVGTQSYNGGEEELYKRVTVQARLRAISNRWRRSSTIWRTASRTCSSTRS